LRRTTAPHEGRTAGMTAHSDDPHHARVPRSRSLIPGVPAVLQLHNFRRFWIASLISNCGSWLQTVAAGYLVFHLTHSPGMVGALSLVSRGPSFVLSISGGKLADRFDRRRIGRWTFALQGLAAAGMAVMSLLGLLSVPVIFALTFALGVGFALGLPAILALVPALVPPGQFEQAVALNAAGVNVARLAGPAVGGVLLALVGATLCFGLNAFSFLALILVLLWVHVRPSGSRPTFVSTRLALRFAWGDVAIRRLLVSMAMFAALAAPIQELAPVIAHQLGAGATGLGLLLGAMGGGALIGAWVLDRLQARGLTRGAAVALATVMFAVMMSGVAVAPNFALGLVAMALCGAFWIWMFILINTSIQLRAPRSMVGRMLGFYQLAVIGPIAIGSLLAGLWAEVVGIRWSLATCALLLALWGAWTIRHPTHEIDGGRAPEPDGAAA
jgi:predicted MFS family arabinose efflux permease